MENYPAPQKSSPVGATFFGVTFDPEGIPVVLFKSLASMIGLNHTKKKLCPFCEETINEEACDCMFCHRILMKQIDFKIKR
jgi:hypothetical protein